MIVEDQPDYVEGKKHHLFLNDKYDEVIYSVIWHDRKMPPKKNALQTRRDAKKGIKFSEEDKFISFE